MKSGRMTVLAVFAHLQDRVPGESPHNLLECPEKKDAKNEESPDI